MNHTDNSLKGARKLRLRNRVKPLTNRISRADQDDIYTFSLRKSSYFNAQISRLKSDVLVELYRAKKSRRKLLKAVGNQDFSELKRPDIRKQLRRVATSTQASERSERLQAELRPGFYYLRVHYRQGNTRYRLKVSKDDTTGNIPSPPGSPTGQLPTPPNPVTPLPTPVAPPVVDTVGNTPALAYQINTASDFSVNEYVGGNDTSDYFQLTLSNISTVSGSISGAGAQLFFDIDGDGRITDVDNRVAVSDSGGAIAKTLPSGDYFLRVSPLSSGATSAATSAATAYDLVLETTPVSPSAFAYNSGYGLVDAAAAVALATGGDPFPTVVSEDILYDASSPEIGSYLWGKEAINALEVQSQGVTGKGVTVAVIDTGIDYENPDFAGNLWTNQDEIAFNGIDDDGNGYIDDVDGWDFVLKDGIPLDISNDAHGTGVAGVIGAEAIASTDNPVLTGKTIGVAPDAQLMPLRVFSDFDEQYTLEELYDRIANAIRYAVDNGADVINMSFSYGTGLSSLSNPNPNIESALQYARQAGVIAVMAAGNEAKNGATRPDEPAYAASRKLGIAVGAINNQYQIADFSSPAGARELPYLMAPGVDIYSNSFDLSTFADTYAWGTGTSFATPYVSGVVALMLEANPYLTPEQVEDILITTASADAVQTG